MWISRLYTALVFTIAAGAIIVILAIITNALWFAAKELGKKLGKEK